ncbi:MAG: HD-GYP domain-containing protein [Peptococcaceae bacterium]|nr:HD-GYP domain-containing protein [Peptococcaceae bacterium]
MAMTARLHGNKEPSGLFIFAVNVPKFTNKGGAPTSSFDDTQPMLAATITEEPLHVRMALEIIKAYDEALFRHSVRVAYYTCRILEATGAAPEQIRVAQISSLLHDLGKITVPRGVLHKPAALSEHEFTYIKLHPVTGARILQKLEGFAEIWPYVKHHHERWDGKGYPAGLAGENIPFVARVICIADAFEAMTAGRPYKKSMTPAQALDELTANAGSQFDPDLVRVFLHAVSTQLD